MTRYDRAKSGAFTPMTRDLIMLRDQWQCVMCGAKANLTIHHRLPRRQGGTRDPLVSLPSNGITLCMGPWSNGCHDWVENNRRESYEQGWLVRDGIRKPAEIPVMHQLHGWVLLTDRGTCIKYTEGGE